MRENKISVLQKRILEILRVLIETPTPTGKERRLYKFLSLILERAGFKIEVQKVPGSFSNLIARRGKSSLLMCTHIDTFPVFSHSDLYKLKMRKRDLTGRGVIDAKGQIASLLVALESTQAPCQIALTSGEEEEAIGSKFLEVQANEGVVLEPTNLSLCLFQAGAIEIEVNVRGKAAHGSLPREGENAILKAFGVYQALEKLSFLKLTHPYFPEGGWINLGKIKGGEDIMVVPDHCTFQADIGVLPGVNIDEAVREVKTVIAKSGASVNFRDISPPVEIDPQLRVVRILRQSFKKVTGKEPEVEVMPSWTDAENLFQKGISCVVFGAGKLSLAHSDYESVSLDELGTLSLILINLLRLWEE